MKDPVEISIETREQFERCPRSFFMDLSDKQGVSVSTGIRTDNKSHEDIVKAFKKLEKYMSETGVNIVILGRQFGKSKSNEQLLSYLRDQAQMKEMETTHRRCDCLKCRMGEPDQCTTYSPKKRRGKN